MHIKIVNNWRVSLKRPYYALVAGKPLCSDKGILRKFATHEAAQAAALKHVQLQQPSAKAAIGTAAGEQAGAQAC